MKKAYIKYYLLSILLIPYYGVVAQIDSNSVLSSSFNSSYQVIEDTLARYTFSGSAEDVSGNGANGTVNGQSLTQDRFGRNGNAILFNGNNSGIQTPFVEQPDAISLWFQTTAEAGTLLSWGSGSEGVYGYVVNVLPTGIELVYNSGDGVTDGSTFTGVSINNLEDGNWHHLVINIDITNNEFEFYVDNERIGATPIFEDGILWATINSVGMKIGPQFTGKIDDLIFFSGILSEFQVSKAFHQFGWAVQANTLVLGYEFTDGVLFDLSGYEFDASVVLATLTPDRFGEQGQAAAFNGIDNYIQTPGVPTYDNFSISTWFKTSQDFSSGFRQIIDLFGVGAISIGSNNFLEGSLRFGDSDFLILNSGVEVNDNEWHHAVLTYNGSSANLFLDNQLVQSVSENRSLFRTSIATFLNVGLLFEPGNSLLFTGSIDDIYYYNYALSEAEVSSLFSIGTEPDNQGAFASYFFNGNVDDDSGNDLNGGAVNAVLTEDRFGNPQKAYNFEGPVYLTIPDNNLFDIGFSTDLAISGWFRTTSTSGILVSKSNQNTGFWIQIPDDGSNLLEFVLLESGLGISMTSDVGFNDGEWHHFVIQTDRDGTSEMYIDGLFNAENIETFSGGANPDSNGALQMGGSGGNDTYEGDLDDIQLYKTLLTEEQIRSLYTAGNYPKIESAEIEGNQFENNRILDSYYQSTTLFGNAVIVPAGQIRFILNQDIDRPYGDDNEDNTLELLGAEITVESGLNLMKIDNDSRNYVASKIASMGFIGSALTGSEEDWSGDDIEMENLGEGIFQLSQVQLFNGEWKIRANDDWAFANWGMSEEEGKLALNGANIPVTAGTYNIVVDVINKTYTFETVGGDNTAPIISNLAYQNEISVGNPVSITARVVDQESSVQEVVVQYIIPGSNNFDNPNTIEMEASGNEYSVELPEVTEVGLEFKIFAKNGANLEELTDLQSIIVRYDEGLSIPYNSFGSQQANYRIVSVPLILNSKSIDEVFGIELGTYGDKSKWRMFRYDNESTRELSGNSTLNPGLAYWLIVNDGEGSFNTGNGKSVDADSEEPFEIILKPGWNLIGNPYPYNVSWSDIQQFNNEEFALRVFNGSFRNGTSLPAFSGGFVNWPNSTDFTLLIPRTSLSQSQNRTLDDETDQGWELDFVLEKDEVVNELTGFGMHKNAQDDLDRKDQFNLPRFLNYIDLKYELKANGFHVAKNIAAMHEEYTWKFDIESNMSVDGLTVKWKIPNNPHFNKNNELMLWDPSSGNLVDMKAANHYKLRYSDGRNLRVIYGSLEYVHSFVDVSSLKIADPYPNPSSGTINIQYHIPKDQIKSDLLFELFDLNGRLINKHLHKTDEFGHDVFEWNVRESSNDYLSGVYLLRISNGTNSINKKIIMNH
ncbi:Por secretion system C-terminal sorting domain-containing protein [Marivirga sericea]|uniref:Por secretion system C-terminal sorting domain-containing protein n=1 Tax=Marivirga sericea TaxID=1028 RepID=A0A1X7IDU9_9BACT|nr:LamG-like jellyroll fold domain-containing protein [Marivirga sericea]SMG12898.1 Por secretion system C-terminal sorting domain-containing protein [Marivirga sericea]